MPPSPTIFDTPHDKAFRALGALEPGQQWSAFDVPLAGQRRARLAAAQRLPKRIEVTTTIYARNPDVVAEVLARAAGVCEGCTNPAPFRRRADDSPYLEVHHRIRLADGGEDTVENAVALCPNCHRATHFG